MSAFLTVELIRNTVSEIRPLFFPEEGAGMLLSLKTVAINIVLKTEKAKEVSAIWGSTTNEKVQKYREFAQRKTDLALRHETDTLNLRNLPHLFIAGDIGWPGGVYRYNGIAVGVSGSSWETDHMIAAMIAEALFAATMKEFRRSEDNPKMLDSI